jgi:hypothetical protein
MKRSENRWPLHTARAADPCDFGGDTDGNYGEYYTEYVMYNGQLGGGGRDEIAKGGEMSQMTAARHKQVLLLVINALHCLLHEIHVLASDSGKRREYSESPRASKCSAPCTARFDIVLCIQLAPLKQK